MPQQQKPDLTPKYINELLTQWKKLSSGAQGEADTIRQDSSSSLFSSFASLAGELLNQRTNLEGELKALSSKLDKIYQSHPEIKIAEEKDKIKKPEPQETPPKKPEPEPPEKPKKNK